MIDNTRNIGKENYYCDNCQEHKDCDLLIDNLGTEFIKCPDCNKVLFIYNEYDVINTFKKVKKIRKNRKDDE